MAQYRRDIAHLKRQQRDLEKRIAQLESRRGQAVQPSPPPHLNGDARFSARSVKAQRRRTGLSAADYAKLVGVSPLTIYNWENQKSRPRHEQLTALVSLRGLGKREAQAKLSLLAATMKPRRPRRTK